MIEKLDKLAQEIFGEFGFDTCTLEQQLIIINKIWVDLVIIEEVVFT